MNAFNDGHIADPRPHPLAEARLGLRAFDAALTSAGSAPIDILFGPGDSITEGAGASSKGNRWQDLVRDGLRTLWQPAGVPGGEGYIPAYSYYNNRFSYSGTYTQPSTDGLGLLAITMQTAATATLSFSGTSIDVFVAKQVSGGTVTASVDGAASGVGFASIATSAASKTNGVPTRIANLPAGQHTLVLTATTGPVIFEGVMVYNGDENRGIRTWNHAHSGQTASSYTSGTSVWTGAVGAIQPSLLITMLGTNDWRTATGPHSAVGYANNMMTAIKAARAVCTTQPSVLIIAPYKPATGTNTSTIGFERFNRALMEIPKLLPDVHILNMYALTGGEGFQAGQFGLLDPDNIHPSDKGHRFIAAAILDRLRRPDSPTPVNALAPVGAGRDAVKSRGLIPFYSALALRETTPVDIVVTGDSISEGARSSKLVTRWQTVFAKRIRTRLGQSGIVGGFGNIPGNYGTTGGAAGAGWTDQPLAISGTVDRANYGLGRRSVRMNSASSWQITIPPNSDFSSTSVDILYPFLASGGGTATVKLDGATLTTLNNTGTDADHKTYRVTIPDTTSSHVVRIDWVSGTFYVGGAMLYRGDETAGIRVWDNTHSGVDSSYYAAAYGGATTRWWDFISVVKPQLHIVAVGTNDFYNGTTQPNTPAQMKANIITYIQTAKAYYAVGAKPSFVVMPVWQQGRSTPGIAVTDWGLYVNAMYEAAASEGALVFDLNARWPAGPASGSYSLMAGDNTHPADAGNGFIADMLLNWLLPS